MSKGTNRHGNIIFQSNRSLISSNPGIPDHVRKRWEYLDKVSKVLFGQPYTQLSNKLKTSLHETLKGLPEMSKERIKLTQAKLL